MRVAVLAAAALVCVAVPRVAAAEEIKAIIVEDNTKTTTDTVALIAKISVGDDWSPEMVDRIKADLVSSGLFKDVEVFYDQMPDGRPGVRVHINVQDKHSWVIAPAFYNQPTNFGGGIGFGENNLFGTNQKLLLYGQIATGDSFFIGAWVIPSIGGTRFYAQLDTFLKSSRNIEYANPTAYLSDPKAVRESRMAYLNGGIKLGVEPLRGLKLDYRFRGARVSYSKVKLAEGATIGDVTGDPTSDPANVPKPGAEGWDVSSEIALTIDRRANWYGIASGYQYRASMEFATPSLGSDFHYYTLNASAYRAWKVLDRHNLVLRLAANHGHHLPFQQEITTGGTTMRGWLNNQFRGDTRGSGTIEYSVPLFEIKGLGVRGLGFWDSAYTTFLTDSNPQRDYLPSSLVRGLDGFKNSVGLGTRLYLRQIVLPLLGLDFGYGLEARDFQVYLAIGLTD